jgi:teichuronic acid biosynthesis glycosyltransferase TuaC
MRILFVAPGEQSGSHMPFVRREAEALRALGHEVQVHGFDNRNYLRFFRELARLRKTARTFDLVHAQFGKFSALAAALSGRPLVVTFRGTDINHNTKYSPLRSMLGRAASQLAACFARGIVCVSREIERKVLARRWRPTIVTPTGVDLSTFRPIPDARAKLGYSPGERIVLFNAGKNPEVKDPALAKAAVERAAARVGEIRFVSLDGTARPQDVPLFMNAADALVLTSRTEGSPTVVQEAMACNLPVVSVDVGDVRERLAGVAACQVISGRDPEAIGTALASVLADGKRSDGRTHAAVLDSAAVAKRLVDFYATALEWPAWGGSRKRSTSSRAASASTSRSPSPRT